MPPQAISHLDELGRCGRRPPPVTEQSTKPAGAGPEHTPSEGTLRVRTAQACGVSSVLPRRVVAGRSFQNSESRACWS